MEGPAILTEQGYSSESCRALLLELISDLTPNPMCVFGASCRRRLMNEGMV